MSLVQPQLHRSIGRFRQLPHRVDGRARGGVEVTAVVDLVADVAAELPAVLCRSSLVALRASGSLVQPKTTIYN